MIEVAEKFLHHENVSGTHQKLIMGLQYVSYLISVHSLQVRATPISPSVHGGVAVGKSIAC